ncbi:hypothetical protein QR680_018266 [Steinernema hermaphroditum]|uniref:Uncharacterized protein n=1 Tax=Steinernema hermaphroditum TaxID=289476 RepID=A0AA39HJM9_9BILA|nr:hypothetical protein QR680_018266 [Steinernema hermaphroditum]
MRTSDSVPREYSERNQLLPRQLVRRDYGALEVLDSTPTSTDYHTFGQSQRRGYRLPQFSISNGLDFAITFVFFVGYAFLIPLKTFVSEQLALVERRRKRIDCGPKINGGGKLQTPAIRCFKRMRGFSSRRAASDL